MPERTYTMNPETRSKLEAVRAAADEIAASIGFSLIRHANAYPLDFIGSLQIVDADAMPLGELRFIDQERALGAELIALGFLSEMQRALAVEESDGATLQ